jgi:hypothetical protein
MNKKSLRITKGQSEADTTMAKTGQNDKQWSIKHYIENKRLSDTNPTTTLKFSTWYDFSYANICKHDCKYIVRIPIHMLVPVISVS